MTTELNRKEHNSMARKIHKGVGGILLLPFAVSASSLRSLRELFCTQSEIKISVNPCLSVRIKTNPATGGSARNNSTMEQLNNETIEQWNNATMQHFQLPMQLVLLCYLQ